ncbi:MAG: hypothetical protein Q4D87_05505 [Actinomycetaceae bacterium]|nr:hypothetical protein [Actinomycetaceae bacterium]
MNLVVGILLAVAGGFAVLAAVVIASMVLHNRKKQLGENSDSLSAPVPSSVSPASEVVDSIDEGEDAKLASAPVDGAPAGEVQSLGGEDAAPAEEVAAAPGLSADSNADQPALGQSADAESVADSGQPAEAAWPAEAEPTKPADDEVVQEASDALDAFDLEATIRKMRREYWASRWLLGEEACDDLRRALGRARGMAASCLSDTAVQANGDVSFPSGCNRMNSVVAATVEPAQPLRALRITKFTHAVASYRAEQPQDVNPHRAAIRAGRYVSPDPTFGLHRLIAEIELGLAQARLEIAKVSPTAGSGVSSRLRSGLAEATTSLKNATERLAKLEAPTPEDILSIESELLRAVWWRRSIDLTQKYLHQREWAETSNNAHEWTRLAVLASRLANVLTDLYEDEAPREHLVKLAKMQILIDQGGSEDRRDVPVRTARTVVETCDELVVNLTELARK